MANVCFQIVGSTNDPNPKLRILLTRTTAAEGQVDINKTIPISVADRDAVVTASITHEEFLGRYKAEIVGMLQETDYLVNETALVPRWDDVGTAIANILSY